MARRLAEFGRVGNADKGGPMVTVDVDELVGWKAIAEYLRVSVETARRWAKVGGLPVYRFMGGVRANEGELGKWVRERRRRLAK